MVRVCNIMFRIGNWSDEEIRSGSIRLKLMFTNVRRCSDTCKIRNCSCSDCRYIKINLGSG